MRRQGLSDEVKTFIVQSLACFDAPSLVARAVKEQFAATVTRQAVEHYDPTKVAGAALSAKFRQLFEETRQSFLAESAKAGAMHRAVRVRRLERMAEKAEAMGNLAEARAQYRQIAEEDGGLLTNARIVRGGLSLSTPKTLADFYHPDGKPITAKEAAEIYADTLRDGG
jgi:hypothetical protein